MKRKYVSPIMQEDFAEVTLVILAGSHIGEGGEGQEGDVKEFVLEDEDEGFWEPSTFKD
ncbi:MAG: hypothetical protein IKP36_13945 [Bacteroidaceae bacterium]|nr:hypothetical protein [Bacteroidaceae bacterium]